MRAPAAPASPLGLLAALLLLVARPCEAQTGMDSPLKGYGTPGPNTTEVYVSAYLDRLLSGKPQGVPPLAYQFESIMYFYLSWVDPEARIKMEETTLQMRDASTGYQCCDGIYIPGFYFKNAYGYSGISYDTYFLGESAVLREVRAMNFANFPFDSFDLLTELRFKDTTRDINVSTYGLDNMGAGRQRIKVIPSSGDTKLFNLGAGDDANNWQVVALCLNKYNLSMLDGVKYSERYSAPGDPAPLWPDLLALAGSGNFAVGAAANLLLRQDDDIGGVFITVKRFGRSSWMDGILPVLVVFVLGLFIFVLDFEDETHLYNRLQLVVTLFLTLIAIQFVLVDKVPASSYMTPMQQLVLATYAFLCCVSLESIMLHCYVAASSKFIWTAVHAIALSPWWLGRKASRLACCKGRGPRTQPAPLAVHMDKPGAPANGCPTTAAAATFARDAESEKDKLSSLGSSHCDSQQAAEQQQQVENGFGGRQLHRLFSPSRMKARLLTWSYSLGEVCLCEAGACPCKHGACPCKDGACPCTAPACDCRLGRCPCRSRLQDSIRRKRTANMADNLVFSVLAVGYTLAAILIFTLQSGYTSIFPPTDDRGAIACSATA
ncbi:hypothetical protein CHLNCDRAFT_137328 [Chlorella variabilis]|uniref:Neurotransmitter-gated ion-channel ligand-binding domain-containing protein n=1 Tax=Chlorella variabilis TaxID=554065 RepID=E1ZM68_CHLVA|nr:hypothetical protein CHLNCDRAFT_137328 [Chlorella variabilis]EFN53057.1 hypothetical protein CHLNCDRAFT_137328 [Chlorella variabilis]|eukprot:XP_005845159.1 hypothetical protein CHLNCDRAFT_137328 [Chlorella variabilis]